MAEKKFEEEKMSDEKIRQKSYVDKKGRWRFADGDGLVARKIAFNEIYLKSRKSYPQEFRDYLVIHRDKNKTNFDKENLVLVSKGKLMRGKMISRRGTSAGFVVTAVLLFVLLIGFAWLVFA